MTACAKEMNSVYRDDNLSCSIFQEEKKIVKKTNKIFVD